MIKAGIIGATGYAGSDLLRILMHHPDVKVETIASKSYAGQNYSDLFENFRHEELICQEDNIEKMADLCDVIFLALPHGISSGRVTDKILKKAKVIDLGADFRLSKVDVYQDWYEVKHEGTDLLDEAVYGLCELHREKIKKARLIANPGCYTTCAILALFPLLKEGLADPNHIIVDAKSGASGAGRGVNLGIHFNEVNENMKAYKIASHRHTPEIEEQLSLAAGKNIKLLFTPHLVPMNRGILSVSYVSPTRDVTEDMLRELYASYYGNEYFIRLTKKGTFPETKWVRGSNFCDIGVTLDKRTNTIVVVSALDNLFKGAAGQAVQNMNLLFNLEEKTGIDIIPAFPG